MHTCLTSDCVSVSNHLFVFLCNCILYVYMSVCVPTFAYLTVCLNFIFGLILTLWHQYEHALVSSYMCLSICLHMFDYLSDCTLINCLYVYVCLYVWFWHFDLFWLSVTSIRLFLTRSDAGKRQKRQTTGGYYRKHCSHSDLARWYDYFDSTHIRHINPSQLFVRLGSLKPVVYLRTTSMVCVQFPMSCLTSKYKHRFTTILGPTVKVTPRGVNPKPSVTTGPRTTPGPIESQSKWTHVCGHFDWIWDWIDPTLLKSIRRLCNHWIHRLIRLFFLSISRSDTLVTVLRHWVYEFCQPEEFWTLLTLTLCHLYTDALCAWKNSCSDWLEPIVSTGPLTSVTFVLWRVLQ